MLVSAGPSDLGTTSHARRTRFVGVVFSIIVLLDLVNYSSAKVSSIAISSDIELKVCGA